MRYAGAIIGPAAVAGAQFAASLFLVALLSQSDYGLFSLAFIFIQFSFGLSNALLGATLNVGLNAENRSDMDANLIYFAANLVFCCFAGTVAAIALFWSGCDFLDAILFALLTALMAMRWFARSVAYARNKPHQVLYSDLTYSVALLLGLPAMILLRGGESLAGILPAFLAASTLGLLSFGRSFLQTQFIHFQSISLRKYAAIWRDQTQFTLIGVVSSEIVANAHAYVVTALSGPDAFAALAIGALLMRPVMLMITSLTQLERPALVRCIAAKDYKKIQTHVRNFRLTMVGSWLANCILAILLFEYFSEFVLREKYDSASVYHATLVWVLIVFFRAQRAPDSTFLQASNAFRPLAKASIIAAPVSLAAVVMLQLLFGPTASLWGVLVGEVVFYFRVSQLRREQGIPHD